MAITVNDIVAAVEEVAPLAWQEAWDNAGWQVAPFEPNATECTGTLLALDVNEDVLRQAVETRCNLVVSHHPLLFKGVKRVVGATAQERILLDAVRHGIAVYAAHTNLDAAPQGVNFRLAERLGLERVRVLAPREGELLKLVFFTPEAQVDRVRQAVWDAGAGGIGNYDRCSYNSTGIGTFRAVSEDCRPFVGAIGELHGEPEVRTEVIVPKYLAGRAIAALCEAHPYEEPAYDLLPLALPDTRIGLGCVGELPEAVPTAEWLGHIARTIGAPCLRHSAAATDTVQRMALCGGSGGEFIPAAVAAGAQLYLTADLKYHDFQRGDGRITLVDGGHFETERQAVDLFYEFISKKFPNFAVRRAEEMRTVEYFIDRS